MDSSKAIRMILEKIQTTDICLFTTGLISRYAYFIADRKANFYMFGSMGLLSSLGLGIAFNTSKKVIIFDGDGSALMDLGTMAMIARYKPDNLLHIILDNEVYESTGNQPTISRDINLASAAKAVGYKNVFILSDLKNAQKEIKGILAQRGLTMLLMKLSGNQKKHPPRVSLEPEKLKNRFRKVFP